MLIGIEAERANNPIKTGVEYYAKQLILHLAEIDTQNQYILYLRTEPEEWFMDLPDNFRVKVLRSPIPYLWTQLRLNWEIMVRPVDVLFVPSAAIPLLRPSRTITTIHDLVWKYYPQTYTFFNRLYLRFSTWYATRFAKKIITVSNSTKNDLLRYYKIDPAKITVTHPGYASVQTYNYRHTFDGPKPYILFLGTLQPRKNIINLIEAVKSVRQRGGSDLKSAKRSDPNISERPPKLVIAGKAGWMYTPILGAIEKHKNFVTYLGYISDKDRSLLLSGAQALVVPSLYEGFGMQILEGFAAGVPVVTSNVSSLPEVAGEAAVYFDPENVSDMAEKIHIVISDETLRQDLVKSGHRRLADFSWARCAKQTLEVLK